MKKSWKEKLDDDNGLPRIEKVKGGLMVIPAPREVDAIMKRVPDGKLITTAIIRSKLARKHKVDSACALTTGIFAGIAAHVADEEAATGKKVFTPYWRTLKADGTLNAKFPGGVEFLVLMLTCEGHHIARMGGRYIVLDYREKLVRV
ncbi:MAG: hypothetical protein WC889_17980 [Myxococcota bacterium]